LHLLFGIVFVLLAFCGMPFAINYVACGDALDTANTIYAMNVSSSSIETCFNVSAENVTLDCAGFSITGEGTRNGIYSDQFNTTIGNCTISNFDAPILFNGATYGTINNVTLEVSVACESACAGIDLDFESDNNQISDITIVSPSPDGIGIYLSESANNKFSRVNITAGYSGIYFNPSPNNTFTNFTIRSLLFAGVYIYHSPNNTISNSVISSTDSFGIYVLASNSINNQILNSTIFSTTNYSIMLEYDASNNSFLGNNITSDLWISDDAGGNFFNDSTSGNIWNTANGTPAADLFDITSSMGTWADGGTSLPLSEASVPDYWSGAGEDGHPWVGGGISCLPEMSLSQADMPAVLACAGSTYTLTENVSIAGSGALTVSAENVSIDCAGYSITGNNSTATYGIYSDQFNTTIKNCGVSNFHHGIYFNSARNGTIQDTNSSSTRASGYGIYLYNGSNYNTVSNAIISADCDSLCIGLSSYNTISNTVVSGHCDTITVQTSPNNIFINTTSTATAGSALYISSSPGATISNSSFTGTYDLYFYNSCFASFANNTGTGGKPIIYANAAANIVSADAAVIIACNISSGLNITASNASSGGIVLYRVNSSSISGSSAATAGYNDAISLIFSSGNTISNTNSTSSVSSALYLDSSSGNIFSGLSLSTASNAGAIRFSTSTNNTISASTVSATNGKAVSFISSSGNQVLNSTLSSSGGYGAYLSSSSGNVFLQNTITSPTWVSDDIGGNTFNNSIVGNKYYLANGTGAWEIYDIVDTNGDGWADIGSDLPFNSSLIGEEWYGYGEDYHPYSFTVAPTAAIYANSWSISYGQSATINCSIDNSQSTLTLYQDNSAINSSTGSNFSTIVSSLAVGAYNFTCNATASENYTASNSASGILTVNQIADTISLALNGTEANLSATYSPALSFPVNASSTTGTHTHYLNGSGISDNYTATLAAGIYNFTAISSGNENYSAATKSFFATISKAASTLTLATNSPVNYLQPVSVNCSIDNSQTAISLYRNGSLVGTSTSLVADTSMLAAGTYNFTCNATASENYTASNSASGILTVNRITDTISLALNGTEANLSATYSPSLSFPVNASSTTGTHTLYLNGSAITDNYTALLAAGTYNFTAISSGNENYSAATKSFFATISKAPSALTLTTNSPVNYLQPVSVNCSIDNSQTAISLYRNGSLVGTSTLLVADTSLLAAGTYNYTCNASASMNYTAPTETSGIFTVNQIADTITLEINRSEANFSGVYGTPLNVSASSNSGTHQLYQNGVEISNPTDEMFAAGIYNFTANSSGNENYTSTVKSFFANISKASATATISANSWSIQYGLSATINCSIDNAQSNLSLYQDNTFINSSTDSNFSTLVSSLAAGAYNFTCNATASENYTASNSVSGLLTVDDAAPVLSIQVPLANSVLANNSNTSVLNFTAFDNGSGLDTSSCKYNVNGTNVSIGSCANGTQLSFTSDGVKTLTVYAKDMAGLEGDATISFMVNTAGENKSIINETTNASVNETIYVTPTSPASNITIALNATNVSLNITAYNSSISFNVTLPEINVNASTSLGNVLLSIPNGTVVSGASDWNGVIQLPSVRAATTFMPTNISGYTNTVQSTVEIGVADVEVNLSKAVRILIPGMAGQLAGFQRNNIFTAITNTCGADSQIWADANILTGSECKINNESDMVIWTKHFTLFGTYTQAVNSPSSGSSTNGGGSVGGGSGAGSSASTLPSASYNVDVGQGSACAVTITREMTSTTNLSTLTTTLENAGGSDCSMTDFVFADTIPSDFPALNEVAFNPQYSSRNGWAVSFNFPTFAAGESKTLTYSANKWIRTSIAKNFTAYTMAAEKKQAVVPAAPTVPTIPEEPSVWVPRKLPSLPNEQPAAAPSATPTAPSEGNQGIFRLVIVLGAIAIVAGTVLFFVLKGRKKKEK